MNMNRAKNLIIIFLFLLNIILFSLNKINENKYQLTNKQETAIIQVLQDNNIVPYTHIIKAFNPLKQIELTAFDSNKMIGFFFDDIMKLERKDEFDGNKIKSGNKMLTIYKKNKSGFLFENPDGTGKIELTKEKAREVCDNMLKKLNEQSLNLELDYISSGKDGEFVLEYRSVFKENIIYSSMVRFRVTEKGIVYIRGTFFEGERLSENAREIYSADEALYALMQELKNIYGNSKELIQIESMDIVYKIEKTIVDSKAILKADPYYRVYVSIREEQPFLINAYTNVVEK